MRKRTVGLIGVSPRNLGARGDAKVDLSGGTVTGDLLGFDDSITTMTSGLVLGRGIFRGHAKANLVGGTITLGVLIIPSASRLQSFAALSVPVPEPASVTLLLAGLAVCGWRCRRRHCV